MCGFVWGTGIMTSAAGQGVGEGALVNMKVESVLQTSSGCTPHSQQSSQPLTAAGAPADSGLPKTVSSEAAQTHQCRKSGLRNITLTADLGVGFRH